MANQDYKIYSIRSAAILTSSYVAGSIIGVDVGEQYQQYETNQLVLLVDFTLGSLDSAEILVETSGDATTYYSFCGGIQTDSGIQTIISPFILAATGKYRIPVQLKDRYIKISAKGTGTMTNSSMAISAVVGVA